MRKEKENTPTPTPFLLTTVTSITDHGPNRETLNTV